MKKIKILVLVIACILIGNLNVLALEPEGVTLENIKNAITSNKINKEKDDIFCFYKYDKSPTVQLYTILRFRKQPDGKYSISWYPTAEVDSSPFIYYKYFDVNLNKRSKYLSENTQNFGADGLGVHVDAITFYYSGSVSDLCENSAVSYGSNAITLLDYDFPEYASEYTDMSSNSEKEIIKLLNKQEAEIPENSKVCEINVKNNNSGSDALPKFKLMDDKGSRYGFYLQGQGNDLIGCFGETDGFNYVNQIYDFPDKFKDTFVCNDYCVSVKLPTQTSDSSCSFMYVKKSANGKCEDISSEIQTSSHKAGSYVTKYIKDAYTSISIFYEDNKLSFELNTNTELTINNVDSKYITAFKDKNISDYPKYLVEKTKGNYVFMTNEEYESTGRNNYLAVYVEHHQVGSTEEEVYETCRAILGSSEGGIMNFLREKVFMVIWIGVPILLIFLTVLDFAKVVYSDDKEGIPNATKRFGKRLIAAILIFLTPNLLIIIVNLIGSKDLSAVNSCIKEFNKIQESASVESKD